MGDADITASAWRNVEVGRVVLFSEGPYAGKLAAIVEIIDHKRVRLRLLQLWSISPATARQDMDLELIDMAGSRRRPCVPRRLDRTTPRRCSLTPLPDG